MLGLSMKILLLILWETTVSYSQSPCSPLRHFPYPYVETGTIAPLINGSHTGGTFYFTVIYNNNYLTHVPRPTNPILGIKTFKTSSLSTYVNFALVSSNFTYTSMMVGVSIGVGYWIQYIQINYVVDSIGAKGVSFGSFGFYDSVNSSRKDDLNYEGNLTRIFTPQIDMNVFKYYNNTFLPVGTNRLMLFLRMLKMNSTQGNLGKLVMYQTGYFNSSSLTLTIFKPLGVIIDMLSWQGLFYSTVPDFQRVRIMVWGGTVYASETGGTFFTGTMWNQSFAITGLSFMHFHNDSSVIDYQSEHQVSLTSTLSVLVQKPYSSSRVGLKGTRTTFFHFFSFVCPGGYLHVYNTVDSKCYDTCPVGTIQTVSMGRCRQCAYNCVGCTNPSWDVLTGSISRCTSCNASNFRTLVSGTCACVNSSYFDDGYSAKCRLCSEVKNFTQTCTFQLDSSKSLYEYQQLFAGNWSVTVQPLYKALNCISGYVLLNNSCMTCTQAMPNCLSCTNATVCTSCSASATKHTDGKCYLCSLANCAMCKQNNLCQTCATGYVINGTSCMVEPCAASCTCGGFYLPKVNGSCATVCGDGVKVGAEECDDSNTVGRDGCSSLCKIQTCAQNCSCSGWYLPVLNGSCSTQCGDGFKVSAEECDDGNNLSHDGCSSACRVETCSQNCSCGGYKFPVVNDLCSTICGDGLVVANEQCDDSNVNSGDGCSSLCVVQNCSAICTCDGWDFPIVNGLCTPICGDGRMRGSEQCDDGNLINYDGCSSICQVQPCNVTCDCSGWVLPRVSGLCSSVCGDSIAVGSQQCDDGNTINADGCSSACIIEPCNITCICGGWHLPRVNGSCVSVCGDGIKTVQQECDDGNVQSHDGCSSTCVAETDCNDSCSCDGWTRPFASGMCSTICGDNLLRGSEECDDGNRISHDGCSQNCKKQTECNQSCGCGGWTQPFVNGSCSTICGDGIVVGWEECDDGNEESGDGCTGCYLEVVLMKAQSTQSFGLFTEQKTYYPALGLFCMGFRIVGMEMLWVFQSFQLLLQAEGSKMKISSNIHGYSNSKDFPFKLPNLSTQFFDKFNYMFFTILFIFMMCTLLQTLGECCRSVNQVTNAGQEPPLTFTKGPNGFGQRQYQFREDRDDGNDEFTVHYDKRANRNDLVSETQALSMDLSELQTVQQPPTFLSKLSRMILRQVFFNMVINVQPIIYSSIIGQIMEWGVESVMNFPTLVTLGIVQLFFVGLLLFCWRGGEFFGENQAKFNENKFMRYWMVTSVEKMLISVIIGAKAEHYLYLIVGIKLSVVIYIAMDKVYYSKSQNYRCMAINLLHLILFAGIIVNKVYLVPHSIVQKLPVNFLEYCYTIILGVVFVITAGFYFRELTSKCEANARHVQDDTDAVHERLFCSKKDINQSRARFHSEFPTSSSIIEQIKSKKYVTNNHSAITQKSKLTQKSKSPHQNYRPSQQYDFQAQSPNKSAYWHKSKRRQRQQNVREQKFRNTEDQIEQTQYARSTKGRSFAKTRRTGKKNDQPTQNSRIQNEQNLNKENTPYQSQFTEESQIQPSNEYHGSKSAYRPENKTAKTRSKMRKAQTQKMVKSIRNVRDVRDQQQDSNEDNYGPVSIRFR